MSSAPRIVLDCDPGIDDAFAIWCALRHCDVAAVTTVSGNVPVEHTTTNALHVLELADSDTPVFEGASTPLEVEPFFAEKIHGPAGLGSGETPPPGRSVETEPAAEAIVRLSHEEPMVIIATGPLTNIALAVQADPSLVDRTSCLYWMGGSTTVGNVTAHAEFNAWADPHAIEVVLASGVPTTMFGLNLTHQVRMSQPHVRTLRSAGTASSASAADYLQYYEEHGAQRGLGQPMHDPCAVLGFTHPEMFRTERANTLVHLSGDQRGMTEMIDSPHTDSHALTVATHAAADDVISLIMEAAINPRAAT